MTLAHFHLKTQQLNKMKQDQSDKNFHQRRYNDFKQSTSYIPPIVDMRKEMMEVRKSKVTLNKDLVNATSSRKI